MKNKLKRYIQLMSWIRELSSPKSSESDGADEYRKLLSLNYMRISELAIINREIFKETIEPALREDRLLTDEEVAGLQDLYESLTNAVDLEFMDAPLLYKATKRLLKDAEEKGDTDYLITSLDEFITVCYAMVIASGRLYPVDESFLRYRSEGLEAVDKIMSYLDKEKFATLSEESKKIVLVMSRYAISIYQHPHGNADEELVKKGFSLLENALALEEDEFYHEQVPSYDWKYHRFRTLEYFASMTERYNCLGFDKDQLEVIYNHTKELMSLYITDPVFYEKCTSFPMQQLNHYRNSYLAGKITIDEYRETILSFDDIVADDDYSFFGNMMHLLAPLEYLLTIDKNNVTSVQEQTIVSIYKKIISYVQRMSKRGSFVYMIGDILLLLENFIELPGGISFEKMCMELMAAIHPPTYVHSLSVADLSLCIATHLYRKKPELFEGLNDYPDFAKIRESIWHAAVCHDVGKFYIVDTIITYGRNLFDDEMSWIKSHPTLGAKLLSQHEGTKAYSNAAMLHHRYHDESGGYPDEPLKSIPDKTVVEIITCADCIDASTDMVGRSYKQGKTLDDFIEEIEADNGKRYAPYLKELLHDKEVYDDIQSILKSGREDNYHRTYRVLQSALK